MGRKEESLTSSIHPRLPKIFLVLAIKVLCLGKSPSSM
jgi:hypothetical protein